MKIDNQFRKAATGCRAKRRAMVLAMVMVTLVLAMAILAALLRITLARSRDVRLRHYQLQAQWLAQSAVGRAARGLEASPDYRGETWQVAAETLPGAAGGVVQIQVTPDPEDEASRRVRIVAFYPAAGSERVRCTKQLTLMVPTKSPAP